MTEQLGRLERVSDLRSVWKNESTDFTPWLQNNIDLLSEKLGLDIQLVDREVSVGEFSVDLLGEEPGSNRPVIIENQLERTDHDHLGKLLTYSAGKNGGVIIWVAKQIRPEHRNALEWLNNATQGNIDFYGVEIELVKIGSSEIAPNFNVVVSPKTIEVGTTLSGSKQRTEIQNGYHKFFSELIERIKARPPRVTNQTRVGYDNWLSTPSGKSGFSFGFGFTRSRKFQIELYIDLLNRQANKHSFDELQLSREAIEEELGAELDWQRLDNKRGSRIAWFWDQTVTILDSDNKLNELLDWALPSYFNFRQAMSQPLENLQAYEAETLPGDDSMINTTNDEPNE